MIRKYRPGDENALAPLIHKCFFEINIKDYAREALQYWADLYTPEHVKTLAERAHMYIYEENGQILGTCSILRNSELGEAATLPDFENEVSADEKPGTAVPENKPENKSGTEEAETFPDKSGTEETEAFPDKFGREAKYSASQTDALVEALYVLPERARQGIASELLAACEADPDYQDAEKIWVDSSITARPFYEKKGYLHETGKPVCIENDRYIMYKIRF